MVKSLDILDHILVVTNALLDRWQHHSWFQNGRDSQSFETTSSDIILLLLKRRRWLAYTNICPVYGEATVDVSAIWQWVQEFEEAQTGGGKLHDKLQNGHICTVVMPHNCQVHELISSDIR
jgi:hypothetical protein